MKKTGIRCIIAGGLTVIGCVIYLLIQNSPSHRYLNEVNSMCMERYKEHLAYPVAKNICKCTTEKQKKKLYVSNYNYEYALTVLMLDEGDCGTEVLDNYLK